MLYVGYQIDAVHMLPSWWRCFLGLHVFCLFALVVVVVKCIQPLSANVDLTSYLWRYREISSSLKLSKHVIQKKKKKKTIQGESDRCNSTDDDVTHHSAGSGLWTLSQHWHENRNQEEELYLDLHADRQESDTQTDTVRHTDKDRWTLNRWTDRLYKPLMDLISPVNSSVYTSILYHIMCCYFKPFLF